MSHHHPSFEGGPIDSGATYPEHGQTAASGNLLAAVFLTHGEAATKGYYHPIYNTAYVIADHTVEKPSIGAAIVVAQRCGMPVIGERLEPSQNVQFTFVFSATSDSAERTRQADFIQAVTEDVAVDLLGEQPYSFYDDDPTAHALEVAELQAQLWLAEHQPGAYYPWAAQRIAAFQERFGKHVAADQYANSAPETVGELDQAMRAFLAIVQRPEVSGTAAELEAQDGDKTFDRLLIAFFNHVTQESLRPDENNLISGSVLLRRMAQLMPESVFQGLAERHPDQSELLDSITQWKDLRAANREINRRWLAKHREEF